jgi:lambda repressor-like predicted transcriptional regulator
MSRVMTPEEHAVFLYQQGESIKSAARQARVPESRLRKLLDLEGVKVRRPGSVKWGQDMEPSQRISHVQDLQQKGYTLQKIADEFGVCKSAIWNMLYRWKRSVGRSQRTMDEGQ